MTKVKTVPFGIFTTNCNVMEYTGDGRPVGRCWFYLKDGICPRHGDVVGGKK